MGLDGVVGSSPANLGNPADLGPGYAGKCYIFWTTLLSLAMGPLVIFVLLKGSVISGSLIIVLSCLAAATALVGYYGSNYIAMATTIFLDACLLMSILVAAAYSIYAIIVFIPLANRMHARSTLDETGILMRVYIDRLNNGTPTDAPLSSSDIYTRISTFLDDNLTNPKEDPAQCTREFNDLVSRGVLNQVAKGGHVAGVKAKGGYLDGAVDVEEDLEREHEFYQRFEDMEPTSPAHEIDLTFRGQHGQSYMSKQLEDSGVEAHSSPSAGSPITSGDLKMQLEDFVEQSVPTPQADSANLEDQQTLPVFSEVIGNNLVEEELLGRVATEASQDLTSLTEQMENSTLTPMESLPSPNDDSLRQQEAEWVKSSVTVPIQGPQAPVSDLVQRRQVSRSRDDRRVPDSSVTRSPRKAHSKEHRDSRRRAAKKNNGNPGRHDKESTDDFWPKISRAFAFWGGSDGDKQRRLSVEQSDYSLSEAEQLCLQQYVSDEQFRNEVNNLSSALLQAGNFCTYTQFGIGGYSKWPVNCWEDCGFKHYWRVASTRRTLDVYPKIYSFSQFIVRSDPDLLRRCGDMAVATGCLIRKYQHPILLVYIYAGISIILAMALIVIVSISMAKTAEEMKAIRALREERTVVV